jgi:hypothetical protein
VPLPTLICLAFASGVAAALAGRGELRVSPRPPMLTVAFAAYAIFATLVLVPASVYFYVFHGDWFLLYLVDVQRVPSAIAMVGFMAEAGIGALGFLAGSGLLRTQRELVAGGLIAVAVIVGAAVPAVLRGRLAVAATYAQYDGQFGLTPFMDSPLLTGGIAMAAIVALGFTALIVRLNIASTRG